MDRGSEAYRRFREEGDEEGLAEIIRLYREGLIFYLAGILGDLSAAEETAEDVFVRLGTKKPRDRGKSSFKTWLYAIGRNGAIDRLRREKRLREEELDEADLLAAETPESAYFAEERKRLVHRAMRGLKSNHRQILWLVYFEDLPVKEVARVMKKSVHAAEMLLSRARSSLKNELKKEGLTDEDL
jgi:RNA polymerase sigma-70 factor (ECF subfamily)